MKGDLASAMSRHGRVFPGDQVAWFKGGRYDDLIIGQVISITPGGNFRITILKSGRSENRPGNTALAAADRTVLLRQLRVI